MDLQQRAQQTKSELQSVKAQIAALERSMQLARLTKAQIRDASPEKGEKADKEKVWAAVGRAFVLSNVKEYEQTVEKREEQVKQQMSDLEKKEAYFAKTLENMEKAVNQ